MEHADPSLSLSVNGETYVTRAATLARLIEELGLAPENVVAEVNGRIVAAGESAELVLCPEDSVELIHFVGGG